MTHLLIRHKVRDFDKWKVVFDQGQSQRAELGCMGGTVYRTSADPNDIAIVFSWEDAKGAREFVESSQLRKSMQEAGVINPPELRFLEFYETFA